jgi:hypothetical protein
MGISTTLPFNSLLSPTAFILRFKRKLDSAKKNISHAITTLKKLNMLIVGIEQQRDFCINKQYKEAGDLIRETGHLLGHFFK